MNPTEDDYLTRQLYTTIKKIILSTARCPDGDRLPCASCLAQSIAKALNDPQATPMQEVVGDIPIFSPKDVQSLLNAAIRIDRQECGHEACARSGSGDMLLMPV